MFLKKVASTRNQEANREFEIKTKEKWKLLSTAILSDKIAEDKLERPIDCNVMENEDMFDSRAKLMS